MLKDLVATDQDKINHRDRKIEELRNLLRDVYDVTSAGVPISDGLLSRIRKQMANGLNK